MMLPEARIMIRGPYTLFTRIPVYLGTDGQVLTDPLWCKDLALHLDYIEDFRLCCPVGPLPDAPPAAVAVQGLSSSHVIPLRRSRGWGAVIRGLLPNFRAVAGAVRRTRIVHSGGAGWPFPLSFYIVALRPFFRFKWVMVIESSFWMKPTTRRPTLREWIVHHVHASLLRTCLRWANARIFTQDGYRQFFRIDKKAVLIAPAIWTDEQHMLSDEGQSARLAVLPEEEVRFLFPARLVVDKGVEVVLKSIDLLEELLGDRKHVLSSRVAIDIVGAGPLAETCRVFSQNHQGVVKVRFLDPVSYGDAFFTLLRQYHAIILANRQDEQPRVVFDAFSQGVAVISSRTPGVEAIVTEEENALLFGRDDAEGLATQLFDFATDPALRATLLSNTLPAVRGKSHADMHRIRAKFLEEVLDSTP